MAGSGPVDAEDRAVAAVLGGTGLVVRSGLATHVGRVREHNEDDALARGRVFVVADGMGGHAAGEVASAIAVATLGELADRPSIHPEDVLAQLRTANDRILATGARHPERAGLGTTATGLALVTAGGTDHWAVFNVGDSRVYRLLDGRIRLLTVDHSEVRELVEAGHLTAEEARRSPLRNVVTRWLGRDPCPAPDIRVFPPAPGERFLLCSDGLSNELGEEQVAELLGAAADPGACAAALVDAAVAAGGRDNVTALVVTVGPAGSAGSPPA